MAMYYCPYLNQSHHSAYDYVLLSLCELILQLILWLGIIVYI